MRVPLNWLSEYVNFNLSPEALAKKLTMAGVPVESIHRLGNNIDKVVTGCVKDIEQHPNADKLLVCKVDVGSEMLTIVTGADNISVDDVVPVALEGAVLPSGIQIKSSSLRGITSQGMLCSAGELGIDSKVLPEDAKSGIMILSKSTPIGVDIKEILGLDDVVLEFELTANRADCFSMLGIAREVAVLTGGSLKTPMLSLKESSAQKTAELIKVKIVEPELCSRFTGRVLRNVKIAPSPQWLQQRLQAAGMRPINNVVDVTNYVMLELGQPMHAYDYNLLSRHEIVVRRAQEGEKITTLDGVKRELTSDMLVIADALQPIGVAGVMGGLATEVTNATRNVFLEAAAFNASSVRRTAKSLGIRSEASGRFERGVDVANVVRALDRAAKLLEDMGACEVCTGIIDVYPGVSLPKEIILQPSKANNYLGTNISASVMVSILRSLGFEVEPGETVLVRVPSWRNDVSYEQDLYEEIARIYGYDNIPSTTLEGVMMQGRQSDVQNLIEDIQRILASSGFDEIISFSFTHPSVLDKLNISENSPIRNYISIMNPITDDFKILRTTLLGSVIETIVRNIAHKNEDLRLFEIGAVYVPDKLPIDSLPHEKLMLCGALTGRKQEHSWNSSKAMMDFYDAKGTVELLLSRLGVADYKVTTGEHDSLHPGKTAVFVKDDIILATVGELHPQVLTNFELNRKVYAFLIDIETIMSAIKKCSVYEYKPLPKYPAITRDIAVVLAESIAAGEVAEAVKESAGPLLEDLMLFDVYKGEQIPKGTRSLAFSMVFRSKDKTLTDDDVDECCKKVLVHLEKTFSAKIR